MFSFYNPGGYLGIAGGVWNPAKLDSDEGAGIQQSWILKT